MNAPAVFPYVRQSPSQTAPKPLLPIRLERNGQSLDLLALVDTGATMNVLPFDIGQQFGFDWKSLPHSVSLGGIAGGSLAKLIALDTTVRPFRAIPLAFAWAQSNAVPPILGYISFFHEFEVCFFARQNSFHVRPHTP